MGSVTQATLRFRKITVELVLVALLDIKSIAVKSENSAQLAI